MMDKYSLVDLEEIRKFSSVNINGSNRFNIYLTEMSLKALSEGKAKLNLSFANTKVSPIIVLGSYKGSVGLNFRSSNAAFILGDCGSVNIKSLLYENSLMSVGASTTINSCHANISDAEINIGRDCMFSHNVLLQPSDQHDIFDIKEIENINTKRSIKIGDHVWLGKESYIGAGVEIGNYSMIAARAVVTKSVSPYTIVAGNPAKVVREGVNWRREFTLQSEDNESPTKLHSRVLEICSSDAITG